MIVISKKSFNSERGEIMLFTLTNSLGASVTLSSLGAGIVSLFVPDREGRLVNVALGYENPASYICDGPCFGKIPGRFANRIARGRFSLDGKEYKLACNNGPNALHGGPEGFQNRLWEAEEMADGVKFTYRSADGEEGYPSELTASAIYNWSEDCQLTLSLEATGSGDTIVNLTNHCYFNLDGEASGQIFDQELKLAASRYLELDDTQIPTGRRLPVEGTPMDFSDFKPIGKDIFADMPTLKVCKGYDHCWVVDDYVKGCTREVAQLLSRKSGIMLTVSTSQPGVQIYTGNWLAGCDKSISGQNYQDYDGVAIECQAFPDAPNHPDFPSTTLREGEKYDEKIKFKFTTI